MTTSRYSPTRDHTATLTVGGPGHVSGSRCDTPRCGRLPVLGHAGLRRGLRYCAVCCEAIDAQRAARRAA